MNSFEEIGLSGEVLEALKELGFEEPTPIQAKAIPHLLSSDKDLIASAQTGTGKTAAFGLPAIDLTDAELRNTQTLILCPTRELCLQITADLSSYSKFKKGLSIVAVYGGTSIDTQIRALRKGAQIVVATPGRAIDLIKRKKLVLGEVERIILDEADEMLTMGFKDDLETIFLETPEEKQIWLFSATMSKRIKEITKRYMHDPVELSAERVNTGAKNVKHLYYMVRASDRYEVLKRIADINPSIYGITFCRTRRETKEIANKLLEDGYNADALHGDMSQGQRDEVMGRFRTGQLQMLVATDVASRGLDVDDLTHVINYNLPDDTEVYVHRSGRTGRAGKHGISIAIINTREEKKIKEIERSSNIAFEKGKVPSGEEVCSKQLFTLIDKVEKISVDEKQIGPFLPTIYEKLESLSREELIKHFVSAEFNRFLAYYKDARDINVPDKKSKANGKRERRSARDYFRLYINVGAKHHLTPPRLIGLINEALNSSDSSIGKIEIMRNFSFFEIEERVVQPLINSLNGNIFEGTKLLVEASQPKSSSSRNDSSRSKGYSKKKKRSNERSGRYSK